MQLSLEYGLSARETFARAVDASVLEGCSKRALAFYLAEIHDRKLCNQSGFADVAHFAQVELHMERRRCWELVDVGQKLRDLELLDDAFFRGEISWSMVRRIVTVATVSTQQEWVRFAKAHNCDQVSAEVTRCDEGDRPGDDSKQQVRPARHKFTHMLTDKQSVMYEKVRDRLSKNPEKPIKDDELFAKLLDFFCEAEGLTEEDLSKPSLPIEDRNHEEVPAELRQQILHRDNHQCSCCRSHRNLHVHHVEHREHGGSNDPENLITLCHACHTSIHSGFLQLHGIPGLGVHFSGPDGIPLGGLWRAARAPSLTLTPPTP